MRSTMSRIFRTTVLRFATAWRRKRSAEAFILPTTVWKSRFDMSCKKGEAVIYYRLSLCLSD